MVKEGENETEGSESVKEEGEGGEGGQEGEQQGVLHQVGGHGAHDKAQAMQVSFLIRAIEIRGFFGSLVTINSDNEIVVDIEKIPDLR